WHVTSTPVSSCDQRDVSDQTSSIADLRYRLSTRSVYRRVTAIRRAGNHLLEGGTHRHIEVDSPGRDRLEEPLVVDRVDRAGAIGGDHGLIDHFLEWRVFSAEPDAIGLDRKCVGGGLVILRALPSGGQA